MKLACASGAFDRTMQRGDLTQLEFIETCARDFACDGVVLDVRHFPRSDADYLAQIKKFATDLGLCIAALSDDAFFGGDAGSMEQTLGIAVSLGTPLVTGRLARDTAFTWSEQLERLNTATRLAKASNVTLALRNAPQTFAASAYDCKRAVKQADSAWLDFGLEIQALDAASDCASLVPKTVLLWQTIGEQNEAAVDRLLHEFDGFLGHLVLDEPAGTATLEEMRSAIRSYRIALATKALNRT